MSTPDQGRDPTWQRSAAHAHRAVSRYDGCVQVPLAWPGGSARASLHLVRSAIVSEARIEFCDWASAVVRLWEGSDVVEVEWTVGPVPVADGIGKEVMLRVRTDIDSGARLAGLRSWFHADHTMPAADASRLCAQLLNVCNRFVLR